MWLVIYSCGFGLPSMSIVQKCILVLHAGVTNTLNSVWQLSKQVISKSSDPTQNNTIISLLFVTSHSA